MVAGSIIHIVEALAIPPVPFVDTASTYNLNYEQQAVTSFLGALYSAPSNLSLASTLNETQDLTIFVPNNIAFETVSGALTSLSPTALREYPSYHIITTSSGPPFYTSSITNENGTNFRSLQGTNLTLTSRDNAYFVNSARIVAPDVLIANGVMHIIDNVLSPDATSAEPKPLSTTQAPVFPTTAAGGSSFNSSAAPFTTYLENIVPTSTSEAAGAATTAGAGPGNFDSSATASASASTSSSAGSGISKITAYDDSCVGSIVLLMAGLFVA